MEVASSDHRSHVAEVWQGRSVHVMASGVEWSRECKAEGPFVCQQVCFHSICEIKFIYRRIHICVYCWQSHIWFSDVVSFLEEFRWDAAGMAPAMCKVNVVVFAAVHTPAECFFFWEAFTLFLFSCMGLDS